MATEPPVLRAVTSSSRQLLLLLRCISFAKKAQVRISPSGIRFSTEEGSVLEAFVFLENALFSSYAYHAPALASSQDDQAIPPVFEVSLESLLETLNIFGLSDTSSGKRPGEYDAFAVHRLNRHAGINAFSSSALGMRGVCTLTYQGEGSPLSIHMSESGVTTTCDLTTYEADSTEEIPFNRDALSLKTIMRSSYLLDAATELSSMSPTNLSIEACPSRAATNIVLAASGALGSAAVEFSTATPSDTPILETCHCPAKTRASFKFALIKAAQRAMGSATKVSLRLDNEGVLSLQFLVEVEATGGGSDGVAFVDFRVVPLVDGEADADKSEDDVTDDE